MVQKLDRDRSRAAEVRAAELGDLDRIMEIYQSAQAFMIRRGNPGQWGHFYPTRALLEQDIRAGCCYVITAPDGVHGVFVLRFDPEPTYAVIEDGAWPNDRPYLTIHRLAGDGQMYGIFETCVAFCLGLCGNIRVDTHARNLPMRAKIEARGFVRCGIIHVADGTPRIAYQYDLEQPEAGQEK